MADFKPSNQIALYDQSGNAAIITSGVGQSVVITSGAVALVSGINTVQLTSGLNTVRIRETFDVPMTTTFVLATSGSGGTALTAATSSYPYGILVKNASNIIGLSGLIMLGTSGSPPFISGGYPLQVGESIRLAVTRPDFVRVYGGFSGVSVGWLGQIG